MNILKLIAMGCLLLCSACSSLNKQPIPPSSIDVICDPFHEYRIIKIDGNDLNDSDRLRGKISFPPGKHSLVLECTLPEPRFNHPKTADLSGTFESGKEYFVLFIGYSKGPLFPVLWDNAIIESSDAERGIIYLKDGGTIRKPNAKSGKGECLAPPPHTTGHAGPHPAVRKAPSD